ncbi:hypothetical protein LVJ94_24770 [Pendulispora rubella]|uniref:Phage protein D n=1 Tax=Pendulispora rubella TaxID=2741070 RepID=A0ABZ2LHK9_9BACT
MTTFLLAGGVLPANLRVVLIATINGTPEVLVDGVVTKTRISSGSGGSTSTFTVTGEDLTALMDFVDTSGIPYPAMPPEARVELILAKYALFGVVPRVIPSLNGVPPNPLDIIPRHQGSDHWYISKLASDAGYVFYLEPGPPLTSIAYWGPEIRAGVPQPALNVDMDAETNVESLNFDFQNDARVLPIVMIQDPIFKLPIPVPLPDINPLSPPLGLIEPIPQRIEKIPSTAKLTMGEAILRGLSKTTHHADAVSGTGSLDVLRYGRTLKARRLVGVRGAGEAFDGLYFVKSVTHNIKRGEYKQDFTLVRNGLVSTVPRVPS